MLRLKYSNNLEERMNKHFKDEAKQKTKCINTIQKLKHKPQLNCLTFNKNKVIHINTFLGVETDVPVM